MPIKKTVTSSPKIGIEPPGLELDLGYSILDARPSVKLKLSLGALSRKTDGQRFSVPLRKWWVRIHGRMHGKRGIVSPNPGVKTSFEDEIARERHLKASDITAASETELGEARKAIEEFTPPAFSAASTVERLRNQSLGWLKLFKEALIQARQNFDKFAAEHVAADRALNDFVKENAIVAKRPPAGLTPWDRAASLAALVVVEALISLPPIAERQGGQLILSFLYPVSVSIANAIVGVLVGLIGVYTLRHSRSIAMKIAAGTGVAFAFLLVAWMNLAVARWREGNDTPLSLSSPLPNTALSIVLLVIAFGVFSFAVYKGVRDFSPGFPGHKEKWDEHVAALLQYNAWKDRYLQLVHDMRRTGTQNLDQVRQELASIRQIHESRKIVANQAVIDLQTVEKVLPELHERINASARVLFKLYRESAFSAARKGENQAESVKYAEHHWDAPLPDIQQVKRRAEALVSQIDSNLNELTVFGDRFEKEVAATLNVQIEAIAAEAKSVSQ